MAISYVNIGTFTSGAAALSVPMPAGIAADDLLILFVESANETVAQPSGWSAHTTYTGGTGTAGAANASRITTFYKVAGASEGAVSVADTGNHTTAVVVAFRGVDTVTPFDTSIIDIYTNTTSCYSTTIASVAANTWMVEGFSLDRDGNASNTEINVCRAYYNYTTTPVLLTTYTRVLDQTVNTGAGGGLAVCHGSNGVTTRSNVKVQTTLLGLAGDTFSASNVLILKPYVAGMTGTGANTVTKTSTGAGTAEVGNPLNGTGANTRADFTQSSTGAVDMRTGTGAHSGVGFSSIGLGLKITPTGSKGYVIGGDSGTNLATSTGINFNTDTTITVSATRAFAITKSASIQNTDVGYMLGGSTIATRIDKFTFNTETISYVANNFSPSREASANGLSSSTKGYVLGGGGGSTSVATVNSYQFSNETLATITAVLSSARLGLATVASTIKGYACGGWLNPATVNEIDGVQFSDETAINPAAALATARYLSTGVSSSTRGYILGGSYNGASAGNTDIDGIQFSDDTAINPAADLASGRYGAARTSSGTAGYANGGYASGSYLTSVAKLIYATEASTTIAGTLTGARKDGSGFSYINTALSGAGISLLASTSAAAGTVITESEPLSGTGTSSISFTSAGIGAQGIIGGIGSNTITFAGSGDGITVVREGTGSNVTQVNSTGLGFTTTPTLTEKVYIMGGWDYDVSPVADDIQAILPSNDTRSTLSAVLASPQSNAAGLSQAGAWGYISPWGYDNIPVHSIQYPTETSWHIGVSVGADLGGSAVGLSASKKGYISNAGIRTTAVCSVIYDTQTIKTESFTFSNPVEMGAGLSASIAGYILAGSNGLTVHNSVKKLSYATETQSTIAATVAGRSEHAGSGVTSATNGYIGGGMSNLSLDSSITNEIDGINLDTETAINPAATLSLARKQAAAGGGYTKGYWAGGVNTSANPVTDLDGILYSSESAINPAAGLNRQMRSSIGISNVTNAVYPNIGTSNTTFSVTVAATGEVTSNAGDGGGANTVDDFVSVATGETGFYAGNGYISAGSSYGSSVDKLKFNDESVSSVSVTLSNRVYDASVFNSSKGYFAGGAYSGLIYPMSSFDMVSETEQATSAGLITSRMALTGVSSATKGYFAGGTSADTTEYTGAIDTIQFSNEACAAASVSLAIPRYGSAGGQSDTTGYIISGLDGGSYYGTIDKILFATSTLDTPTAGLHGTGGATGHNSLSATFICGGGFSGNQSWIDELIHSTEAVSTLTATLNTARAFAAGVASFADGYLCGGSATSTTDDIEGFEFLTRTAFNPSSVLSTARYGVSGIYFRNQSNEIGGFFLDFNFATVSRSLALLDKGPELYGSVSNEFVVASTTNGTVY